MGRDQASWLSELHRSQKHGSWLLRWHTGVTGFRSGNVTVLLNTMLSLAAGRGEINWLDVPGIGAFGAATHVLETVVTKAVDDRVVSVTSTTYRPLSSGSIAAFSHRQPLCAHRTMSCRSPSLRGWS